MSENYSPTHSDGSADDPGRDPSANPQGLDQSVPAQDAGWPMSSQPRGASSPQQTYPISADSSGFFPPNGQGTIPQPLPFDVHRPMSDSAIPARVTIYPMFWRTPCWRWWKPIVAVVLAGVLFAIVSLLLMFLGIAISIATGHGTIEDMEQGGLEAFSDSFFLANNVSLALLIPISMAVSAWVMKQAPGLLASVEGRIRWAWLGRCLLIALPILVVFMALQVILSARSGNLDGIGIRPETWLLIVGIIVTTPFQAMAEEYAFRGVLNRAVASFFRNEKVGLVAGAVVSSLAFMFSHGAGDMGLNIFYFFFGIIGCMLAWRTGGLEASIAVHVINNLLAEALVPFSGTEGMFDRSAGSEDPLLVLISIVSIAIVVLLLVRQARSRALAVASAPGMFSADSKYAVSAMRQPPVTFHPPFASDPCAAQPGGPSVHSPVGSASSSVPQGSQPEPWSPPNEEPPGKSSELQ